MMTRKLLFILLFSALILTPRAYAEGFDQTHQLYGKVLDQFTKEGSVDYRALRADSGPLDRYLDQLAAVSKPTFDRWNRNDRLAFLINLYNAATLKLILDHYPVESIRDIGHLFKGPWDQPVVRLWGRTTTLDAVEHQILREQYQDPRVHFALVCASLGCPRLRQEPYRGDHLDRQLRHQIEEFLSDREKFRIDPESGAVYLSPIFKWFSGDFEAAGGAVGFIKSYLPESESKKIPPNPKLKWLEYDWNLNERKLGRA